MAFYDILKKAGFSFVSSVPSGPAYIMPDGKFLDISSSMRLVDPTRTMIASHPAIDSFLFDNGYLDPSDKVNRVLCSSDNAIRVNDGTNLLRELVIGLPPSSPTPAQYEALENWIWHVYSKGGVDVGNDNSTVIFKHYDFSELEPREVVDKIKGYYSTGKLRDKSIKKSV